MKIGNFTPVYPPRQQAEMLARVAAVNPDAIVLMANMIGAGPCGGCNFVRNHCRCKVKAG